MIRSQLIIVRLTMYSIQKGKVVDKKCEILIFSLNFVMRQFDCNGQDITGPQIPPQNNFPTSKFDIFSN